MIPITLIHHEYNTRPLMSTKNDSTFRRFCKVIPAITLLVTLYGGLNNVQNIATPKSYYMKYSEGTVEIQDILATSRTRQELTMNVLDKIQAFMNDTIKQRPLPPNTPGAFLHVGKAGGSTLCSVLQNPCHSFIGKPCPHRKKWENGTLNETYLGALTTYIHTPDFHVLGQQPEYSNFDFYVANLRDPFSKFLSAFTYMHPENRVVRYGGGEEKKKQCRKLYSCFPSLERFVELVGDNPLDFEYPLDIDTIETKNCTNLARAAMANRVKSCISHFYWNIKSILERIPGWNNNSSSSNSSHHARPPFMAIRTEYMSQDFFTANSVLGDPHPVYLEAAGGINGRVQSLLKVSKNISSVGRMRLCKALLPEYKVYTTALSRAINLSDRDRQNSLKLSQQTCPDLAWLFRKDLMRRH